MGVFVDVQNLYYSAKNLYSSKVDYGAILKQAVKDRILVRAFSYVIRADIPEEENFFNVLEKMGFDVRVKDLQVFYGGAKKGDWDVGICMDAIELAPKLDVVVLVSGDGDYIPLLEHLRHAFGCRVEVIAFGKSCSSKLKETADDFFDLDSAPKRFCFR